MKKVPVGRRGLFLLPCRCSTQFQNQMKNLKNINIKTINANLFMTLKNQKTSKI